MPPTLCLELRLPVAEVARYLLLRCSLAYVSCMFILRYELSLKKPRNFEHLLYLMALVLGGDLPCTKFSRKGLRLNVIGLFFVIERPDDEGSGKRVV